MNHAIFSCIIYQWDKGQRSVNLCTSERDRRVLSYATHHHYHFTEMERRCNLPKVTQGVDSRTRTGRQGWGHSPYCKMGPDAGKKWVWSPERGSRQPAELREGSMARSWRCPGLILAPTGCLQGEPRERQARYVGRRFLSSQWSPSLGA